MIRERFWPLLFVSAIFILPGTYSAQSEGETGVENLVRNADFEDPDTGPWWIWIDDKSVLVNLVIDKSESYRGDQSMRLDITKAGNGLRVEFHQSNFVLDRRQRLVYTFWAKTEEGKARPARMIVNHSEPPWNHYGIKDIMITDHWTEFLMPVFVTIDDEIAGIYVELKDTVGTTWFDHFRL